MRAHTGSDVVDALVFASHRVRNYADAQLRECGLSFPSYKLMRALEISDRSMREISEILHNAPRTVTDMIDSLESRGLVARVPHPADRRVTLVRLTGEGRQQLGEAVARAEQANREAVRGLSAPEQKVLRELLDRIVPTASAEPDVAVGRRGAIPAPWLTAP